MSLTGIKDVDREILKHVDDKELLEICTINKKTWDQVCDDAFLRRRLLNKYPEIGKYKAEKETWKRFFLRAIYYISKLKEDYKFTYSQGSFEKQHSLFKTYKGDELLVAAAREGEVTLVKHSAEQGFDITAGDEPWNEALRLASVYGHLKVVKYLIENRIVDVHTSDDEALISASLSGHLDVVKYLVENGADVHAEDDDSLIYAGSRGHLEIVKYLLEHGADIHAEGEHAVRFASENGHFEVVKYLVEHGADFDTALQFAKAYEHSVIVKYLEELKIERENEIDKL